MCLLVRIFRFRLNCDVHGLTKLIVSNRNEVKGLSFELDIKQNDIQMTYKWHKSPVAAPELQKTKLEFTSILV